MRYCSDKVFQDARMRRKGGGVMVLNGIEQKLEEQSKRLDSLCRQLIEFSHDTKEMLKSHEERIIEHELDSVKKVKDIEGLANSTKGILAIIKWTASTVFLLLAGFFIWYIQNIAS